LGILGWSLETFKVLMNDDRISSKITTLVNQTNRESLTPFHQACLCDKVEIVKYILADGFDENVFIPDKKFKSDEINLLLEAYR